jgi:tRNA modification GTPase
MNPASTILAVATPPARSLRAVIRISGPHTLDLVRPHLHHHDVDAQRTCITTRTAHAATLHLLPHPLPCLASIFPAPNSYTGEDSVELLLPGHPLLLDRVIDAFIDAARAKNLDARRAEPGEYTARAFLNAKLDLLEAEGVAASIAAHSDAELRAAHMLLHGALGSSARAHAEQLANALALVEAAVDFTDAEDVIPITAHALSDEITTLINALTDQLAHAAGAEQLEAIPWVVIAGPPNAGKSTLFNALLQHDRAIVSSLPGATRDVLTEPLTINTPHGPAEIMLVDIAGHDRDPGGAIDIEAQHAARAACDRAELILHCIPLPVGSAVRTGTPPATKRSALKFQISNLKSHPPPDPRTIIIRTMSDQCDETARAHARDDAIIVSAHARTNLDAVTRAIAERLADRAVSLASDALVLRPRHERALRDAFRHLEEAQSLLDTNPSEGAIMDPELVASALRAALDDFSILTGRITPDDILGRVFASFCVGK